jgi:HlyD family secretion protein
MLAMYPNLTGYEQGPISPDRSTTSIMGKRSMLVKILNSTCCYLPDNRIKRVGGKMKVVCYTLLALAMIYGCKDNTENQYTGVLEGTQVKVPSLSGGQILALYVDEGDQVITDQKLALIDSTELSFQRQLLQASLREIKIQQEIAQTAFEKTSSDMAYVQEKYDRINRLYQTNSTSRQNLDDVHNQLQNATAAHRSARQNLQSLLARQEQIQIQINLVQKKIRDTVVLAPCNGIITTRYYETGEAVMPLSAVVEIIDIRTIETKIYISESLLSQLKYDQTVQISIDGVDKKMTGRISWISPKAEFTPKSILTPETRTSLVYAVEISIANPEGILKHGMPVVVEL